MAENPNVYYSCTIKTLNPWTDSQELHYCPIVFHCVVVENPCPPQGGFLAGLLGGPSVLTKTAWKIQKIFLPALTSLHNCLSCVYKHDDQPWLQIMIIIYQPKYAEIMKILFFLLQNYCVIVSGILFMCYE